MAFKDFSTNNFQLTAFGNAQISTSVKKYGDGSAYFDGNGDYISLNSPSESLINWYSTDYTLECWVYLAANPTNGANSNSPMIGNAEIAGDSEFWSFGPLNNRTVKFYYWSGSQNSFSTTTTLNLQEWYHLAFVKNGTSLKIYINGIESASQTLAVSPQSSNSYPFSIGQVATGNLNGYIDDLRITKGIARYTSNFTPPQQQLPTTTDPHYSNVSLLLPMNLGPFKDSSTNNFQLTPVGNADLSTVVKKYGTASSYFDGNSVIQSPIDNSLSLGAGDFTIEFWAYPITPVGQYGHFVSWRGPAGNGDNVDHGSFSYDTVNKKVIWYTNTFIVQSSNNSIPFDTWTHVSLVRTGSDLKIYINGVNDGSANIGSQSYDYIVYGVTVGSLPNIQESYIGYIDDLRITKGVARYTSNFTPPQQQLPDPSDPYQDNVSLLLHMDGLSGSQIFTDSSSNNFTLSAFGDAQISTSIKKFGSGSGYFDGSGDYVEIPAAATITGTEEFTIECWVYPSTLNPGSGYTFIYGFQNENPNGNFSFGYITGGYLFTATAWQGIDNTTNTNPLNLNEWNHVALTRKDGRLRAFVNGIKCLDVANTNNYPSGKVGAIGGDYGGNTYFNGYIDELRITKGFARYTSNFVPHTAPFVNPPFTPTSISELQLWLDGADSTTMYDATVGGSLVAANGAIARWEDKSGNNKHATQSTSNNRPLRRLSQQNGLDGVEFDGNDDFVEGNQVLNSQPYTVIVVCKFTDSSEIGCYFGQTTGFIPFIYKWGTGGEKLRIFNGTDLTSNSSVTNGTWYVLRNVGNTSNSQIYINNVLDVTSNNGTATPAGNYVIANFNNSQYQGLVYGELLVYNKVLTTEETAQIETYLNNKWNVY